MDINDYNTKLASTRKRYRDAATSLKENYEKDLSKVESTNEAQRTKQRENYLEDKVALEKKVEQMGDNYNTKTRETIEQKQNEYKNRLMDQKGDYDEQMADTKKQFRQRLDDLSRSYNTNATERERTHDQNAKSSENRYKESLNDTIQDYRSQADRVSETAQKSQVEFKDKMNSERRNLLADHAEERQNLIRKSAESSNASKSQHQEELQTLRKVQDSELNTRQAHHDSLMGSQRYQHDLQNARLRESFENLTDKMENSTTAEMNRLNRENKKSKLDLQDRFSKDRGALERKLSDVEKASSYLNAANAEERVQAASDTRVKNVIAKMDEQAMQNVMKEQRLNDGFQQELDSQAIRSRQEIEDRDKQIFKLNGEVIGGIKQKHMEDVETYQQAKRDAVAQAEEKTLNAQKAGKRQASTLHLEYGRQINALQKDNAQVVADLRQEQAAEQIAYLKNVQRNVRNEKLDLKDDFNNKFNIKVDQLSQQIAKLEQEQKQTVEKYEQKIQEMKKQELQNSVSQQLVAEDRRTEDQRAFQRAFKNQQTQFDDQLKRIKRDVETQMAKIKHTNDVQVATITRDYDHQIMRERQESQKEMKMKLAAVEAEFMRFKDFHESQVAQINDQYELKMEKLRQANADANVKREERVSSGLYNA
ncbi:MAG: hypothetical protein CME71_00200 [Halobacteriovorax sp.]|nr:hypothetical protein [Halobacteriovorax sp.]